VFAVSRGSIDTTITAEFSRIVPARRFIPACRIIASVLILGVLFLAARPVVPSYMLAQRAHILVSAQRHGIASDVLAAVLYNEMLGQESRFLSTAIPGDNALARAVRESLLGWHFLTLKQAQWALKGAAALAGFNTTVGPTGIRVSVGREIRHEIYVEGGRYQPLGLAERPSLVLDLMSTSEAIEYLAANLQRGERRATIAQRGDWTVLARWHNTGVTEYSPSVPPMIWDKGTNYIARVSSFLPEMTALLRDSVAPPMLRVMLSGPPAVAKASRAGAQTSFVRSATMVARRE
jgi:hypothetical protein